MSNYRLGDFEKGRWILRYLAGTKEKVMRVGGNPIGNLNNEETAEKVQYQVTGFSDATWADDEKSRKSTSGTLVMVNGSAVAYRSCR